MAGVKHALIGFVEVGVDADRNVVRADRPRRQQVAGVPACRPLLSQLPGAVVATGGKAIRLPRILPIEAQGRQVQPNVEAGNRRLELAAGQPFVLARDAPAETGLGIERVAMPLEADEVGGIAIEGIARGIGQIGLGIEIAFLIPPISEQQLAVDIPRIVAHFAARLILSQLRDRIIARDRRHDVGAARRDQMRIDERACDGRAGGGIGVIRRRIAEQIILLRLALVDQPPRRNADSPGAILRLDGDAAFGGIAPQIVMRRELIERLVEILKVDERPGLVRRAGGDVDDAAHRIARIARRIGAIDDVELLHFVRPDDPPCRGIAERIAEEVRNHEAIDHHQRARALRGMSAAKSRHRIIVADVTGTHEEIGRVFDQILGVEGVDPGELFVAKADGKPARLDRDRRAALPYDQNIAIVGRGRRLILPGGERRRGGERRHADERACRRADGNTHGMIVLT